MSAELAHEVPLTPDDLAMLQRVYKDVQRERPDYVRALGEEAIACLLIRLFQMGHTQEGELRWLATGGPGHPRKT